MANEPEALTSAQRKFLRGLAHKLQPAVHVGQAGITDAVMVTVNEALDGNELIKVRLQEPEDKKADAEQLAGRASAQLCGLIGHTVILFRKHPDKPRIQLPG